MKKNISIFRNYILPIIIVIALVFLDQFTKYIVSMNLKDNDPIILIKGVFQLQYLENRGAAFGMMQNKQFIFVIGAVIITLVIVYFWKRMNFEKKYIPLRICSILIIAGAIGNVIDRVINHYVIDFFYFELINFPIFNVADIYVTVACFLFAFLIIFYYKEDDLHF